MPKPVIRIGADRNPQWLIYGSYVLDILFGRQCARDMDVAFDPAHRRPLESEIEDWRKKHGFQPPRFAKHPQFVREADFLDPKMGGVPYFNIDYWQLRMDGQLYRVDPGARTCALLTLDTIEPIRIIRHPVDQKIAEGALEKMKNHPELHDPDTECILMEYAEKG